MPIAPTTVHRINDAEIQSIAEFVHRKSAIQLDASKAYMIESRIIPVLQRHGLSSITELVSELARPSAFSIHDDVINSLTTNESSFYRDQQPFDALRNVILPKLINQRSDQKELRIWSAACSSGQEIYSIALTIREHFPELLGWRLRLFGTDISKDILDKAKAGYFSKAEVARGLPPALAEKYFDKSGDQWQIQSCVRDMVTFTHLNLAEHWPASIPQQFDIVLLRNVLIYFGVDTKAEILTRVRRRLASDGLLMLGAAETTLNLDVPFTRQRIGQTTCYVPN
ncbi:MAG TPA: chemotaxis protein CheR [Planctomycetaceae bacterium]|nr:chemotaxis protein CheR [Planctomycetaceae bacterium]